MTTLITPEEAATFFIKNVTMEEQVCKILTWRIQIAAGKTSEWPIEVSFASVWDNLPVNIVADSQNRIRVHSTIMRVLKNGQWDAVVRNADGGWDPYDPYVQMYSYALSPAR